MLLALGRSLFSSGLGLGFQRRHGLSDLLQPALPKGQLLRQLVTAPVLAVPTILFLICLLGPAQQLIQLNLGRIRRHVAQLHQIRPLTQHQHLQEQPRQRRQVILPEVRDGAEARRVIRRHHPEGDVLVRSPGDAS